MALHLVQKLLFVIIGRKFRQLIREDVVRRGHTCYEASHLDTKNKYGFFLDDNHAFVEIETGYPNHHTLFVIKDSYANCFIPLLIPHYEKI